MALPKGMEAFQTPRTRARIALGNMAAIKAVPPGAYPASPSPMAVLALKSCMKFCVKAQANVAALHKRAIRPMLFLRLQRSISTDTGRVKMRMDQ